MTVAIISTGGTISSISDEGTGATPELEGSYLVDSLPVLDRGPPIETCEFANVPSAYLTIEQMSSLTEVVQEYSRNDDLTGIVVTVGTDVLEEVAYFVDLCYGGPTPDEYRDDCGSRELRA
ncbi:asparaginase domain-containing protein [Halorarum salinum]|uniref:Asparaginase n=1 Tax=Halorarum salinum TaxID=2743089 RepID=A0A7D5L9S0_9EURY|nr:asparaginase domain-containing protein [Halobaculum salinum]QLG61069.1 asparaginase [Halobaculum salinum]